MTYPEDAIQSMVDSWWVEDDSKTLDRGVLVRAFVNHFDQVPYGFLPTGRTTADAHNQADVEVIPLRVGQSLSQTSLPVAGMPLFRGEVWAANKAKARPCIVINKPHEVVKKSLTKGMPNSSTASAVLIAPYYGADKKGRAGYNPELIERIRHCMYPQFMWDKLPLNSKVEESILRLDQIQPIGKHYQSYQLTGYKLSDTALAIFDDLIRLSIWGELSEDSDIAIFQSLLSEYFYD